MQIILHFVSQTFANIGPFFILLGLLIFVHEFGHFIVARMCGVRVETFSLGFGKKIFQYKPGKTNYCISMIPLGGYVKMYGDDPSADIPVEQRSGAFLYKNVGQRIAIVLAGPAMNLIFATFLFMLIARLGEEVPSPIVGDIAPTTVAYQAGFRSGDKVAKIGSEPIQSWLEVQELIEKAAGQTLSFQVQHSNGVEQTFTATPTASANENILSYHHEVGHIDGLSPEALAGIVGVIPGGLAEKAGLQSIDLITSVNDLPVSSFADLENKSNQEILKKSPELRFKVRTAEMEDKPENHHIITVPVKDITVAPGASPLLLLGIESAELYILKVKPGSPAAQAGIVPKDRIVKVEGNDVQSWNEVLRLVKNYDPAKSPINFEIRRGNEMQKLAIRPEFSNLMNSKNQEEKRYTVGIISGSIKIGPDPVLIQIKDPIRIVQRGFSQSAEWTGLMVMSLVRLAQGQVSSKNIGGVITIGRVASRSFELGISAFLKTMAIISINLFLLNLLPVPVLDGGHLLFFSIEALKGTPISLKKLELAQQVGLTLLIMLMAFAFFNDISNLISARW